MNKSTLVLVIVFLGLAALAAYFLWPREGKETSYSEANFSLSVDSASIVKVQIERAGGKSVTLENQGGKWMVTVPIKYPANLVNIGPILGGMSHFKVGSLVSSNPAKQEVYQVDSSGTKLTVTDRAGKMTSLIVGKMGPSYDEIYFRKDGSNDVYLGTGINAFSINQEVREWRDKTIMATYKDSIKRLEYVIGSKSFVLQREGVKWFHGEDTVDANTMNSLLTTVMDMKTEDFADTLTTPPTEGSHLKVSSTKDIVINFYPQLPDTAKYFLQTSESPQYFIVGKYMIQNLLKPIEDKLASTGTGQKGTRKKK